MCCNTYLEFYFYRLPDRNVPRPVPGVRRVLQGTGWVKRTQLDGFHSGAKMFKIFTLGANLLPLSCKDLSAPAPLWKHVARTPMYPSKEMAVRNNSLIECDVFSAGVSRIARRCWSERQERLSGTCECTPQCPKFPLGNWMFLLASGNPGKTGTEGKYGTSGVTGNSNQ
jgi:hypothetical protein